MIPQTEPTTSNRRLWVGEFVSSSTDYFRPYSYL